MPDTICKKIEFYISEYKIKGHLHIPRINQPPVVIGSHGLFATQDSPKQHALARACNARGMAFFRFDHRGCGHSEGGNNHQMSFESRCEDLLKACKTMKECPDTSQKIALFGSSMGGAVACRVATTVSPSALVTFAAPVSSDCIFDTIQGMEMLSKNPRTDYRKLIFSNDRILAEIQNILIFHGDHDSVVPISEAHRIYQKAGNPKKLIIQEGGDHRMSHELHQDQFVREAALWFDKRFERS